MDGVGLTINMSILTLRIGTGKPQAWMAMGEVRWPTYLDVIHLLIHIRFEEEEEEEEEDVEGAMGCIVLSYRVTKN